jgi:hypothetical protein
MLVITSLQSMFADIETFSAEDVSYIDANGDTVTATAEALNTSTTMPLTSGWYIVDASNTTFSSRIVIQGDVNLILADNTTLQANAGIDVSAGNSLTIYQQPFATAVGAIVAIGDQCEAGIGGGNNNAGGTITINGGNITATGGNNGAGIGGGCCSDGGTIVINQPNGATTTVNATGGGYGGAGIGGGSSDPEGTASGAGGNITITGGTVTATGNSSTSAYDNIGGGAGIGGAGANNLDLVNANQIASGASGNINITGGTITANGGNAQSPYGGGGAGIGSGGAGGDGSAVGLLGVINIPISVSVNATGGTGSTPATELDGAAIGYGGGYAPPAGTPSAMNITAGGSAPRVGTALNALYTYNAGTGAGTGDEGISTYQWYRSTSSTWDGNAQVITNATGEIYTPTGADIDMFLYFQVTPTNVSEVAGPAMQSPATGIVGIQVSLNIVGNNSGGTATINAGAGPVTLYNADLSPTLEAVMNNAASVTWSVSDNDGTFTTPTYNNVTPDNTAAQNPGYSLPTMNDSVTTPITITATFTASNPPTVTNINANKDNAALLVGTPLTGEYTYTNGTGVASGADTSTYQWYRSTSNTWNGSAVPIPVSTNATSTSIAYTPTGADVGFFLYLQVTPTSGGIIGTPVQSPATAHVGIEVTLTVESSDTDETATINGSGNVANTSAPATITVYNNNQLPLEAALGDAIGVEWTTDTGAFLDNSSTEDPNPTEAPTSSALTTNFVFPTLDDGITAGIEIKATFTHPEMPSVSNITVTPDTTPIQVGTVLTASYDFTLGTGASSDNNTSTITWYRSPSATWGTDTETVISTETVSLATSGATTTFTTTYTTTGADFGMYIFFQVEPKNDTYTGDTEQSDATAQVGIAVNLVIENTGTTGSATMNTETGPTSIVVTPSTSPGTEVTLNAILGDAASVLWTATAGTFNNDRLEAPTFTLPTASDTLNTPITVTATFTPSTPPTATAVTITDSANPLVGAALTGSFTYAEGTGQGAGTQSGTTYQWYRSTSPTWDISLDPTATNATLISNPNSNPAIYTPTGADVGQYLYLVVTPSNGTLHGTPTQSAFVGPVGIVVNLTVIQNDTDGTASINDTQGTASVTIKSTTPPTVVANLNTTAVSVVWWASAGGFTDNASLTPGYTFPSPMDESITSSINITATFAAVVSTPPTATQVTITDSANPLVGAQLIGGYIFNQGTGTGNSDQQGTTFQWYRSSTNTPGTGTEIYGAISMTYTPTGADVGQYLFFGVTPRNNMPGTEARSPASGPVGIVINLNLVNAGTTGTATIGDTTSVTVTNPDVSPIAAATIGNAASVMWTVSSGGGTFSDATLLNPIYALPDMTISVTASINITATFTGQLPSANNVNANVNAASPDVGTLLTGGYNYVEGTGTANARPQGTSTFQWYRNSTNTWSGATLIPGATLTTYTPTGADVGQFLFFQVTPRNDNNVAGTPVQSAATGPVGLVITLNVVNYDTTGTATMNGFTDPVTLLGTGGAPTLSAGLGDAASVMWTVSTGGGTITNPATINPTYSLPTLDATLTSPITITATFTPPPPIISLSQASDLTFSSEIFGYSALIPSTITVTNVGNVPTGALTVALSGTNAGSFTVTPTSINSLATSATDTFTVVPNTGLSVGTYTAMVTVRGVSTLSPQIFNVSFTVTRAAGATLAAPTVSGSPTPTDITVNTVSNTSGNGQAVAYAISTDVSVTDPSNLTWQSGTTFTGLLGSTEYYIYAYAVQNANFSAGLLVVSAGITTAPPVVPDIPQNLTVTIGDEEITASWEPPLNDGGRPIVGYRIQLRVNPIVADITVSASELTHTFTGLTNGLTYIIDIWALNEIGESAVAAESDAVPEPSTPTPPPETSTPPPPPSPPSTPPPPPPDTNPPSEDKIPQTGESKITGIWLIIMLLSFISILATITWCRLKYLNTVARNNK